MLEELRIRGLGVIDDATLPLGPGLTVVTGETGAGKTMVVTGLLLLFGGRADSARIRTGAGQAEIEGQLRVDDSVVRARVEHAGGELDDDGLVLRRVVAATGRSRAYVGGVAAPVAVLADLAERLLSVHGQSDQLLLTRRGEQVGALDRFAGIDVESFTSAYSHWRAAVQEVDYRLARAGELSREADLLAHGIEEIEAVAPEVGEDLELSVRAERLAHADALRLAADGAHHALVGDHDDRAREVADANALIGAARHLLEQQAGADPAIATLAQRASEIGSLVVDLAGDLRDYSEQLDADPDRLAEIEERRSALRSLVRKYGDAGHDVAAVIAWADAARTRLLDLDMSDEAIAAMTAERDALAADVARLADQLTERRVEAASRLGAAVGVELDGLAMPGAVCDIVVRARAAAHGAQPLHGRFLGSDGADDVEFLLRPHPQAPLLPIARGASGGELSRVMLALEVCLAGTNPVPTMIFDEIDAGVGGRAAVEVGRRLARLAQAHQVIVVTHLPQVAAYADRHIVLDKFGTDDTDGTDGADGTQGVTTSDVRVVSGDELVTELARMLAGTDSAAARRHASELLDSAAQHRASFASAPATAGRQRSI